MPLMVKNIFLNNIISLIKNFFFFFFKACLSCYNNLYVNGSNYCVCYEGFYLDTTATPTNCLPCD